MRKFILGLMATAAIAAPIAMATSADASVNVTNGSGFVGKGDVQDALGLANDAAMQNLHKANGVKFTNGGSTGTQTIDYTVQCSLAGVNKGTVHWTIKNPFTDTANVSATANTNGAGKLTNGWNLTGQTTNRVLGKTTSKFTQCPIGQVGSIIESATTIIDSNVVATSGLKVNGVDLPNTPVEVPVV